LQQRFGQTHRQETGATALRQNQLYRHPADIDNLRRPFQIRVAVAVLGVKSRRPIDINVIVVRPGPLGIGRQQHQCFVEQMFDLQAGAVLGRVHQAYIQCARH